MIRSDYVWSKEEIGILKDNYGKISVIEITSMLEKRRYSAVRHKIRDLGLHLNNNLRKYNTNKECFKNFTPNCCYWAGFIAADGNISDKGVLSIALKVSDKSHLDKFVKFMDYTNKVKEYKDRCYISLSCKVVCDDLQNNFNITPRKSKTLKPPYNIECDYLVACFIKGVIDGDGSVMSDSICIYGTEELLTWIKSYFDKWTLKTNYKVAEVRKIQKHLYAYKISTSRRDFIYEKLKNLNCDELDRKWE